MTTFFSSNPSGDELAGEDFKEDIFEGQVYVGAFAGMKQRTTCIILGAAAQSRNDDRRPWVTLIGSETIARRSDLEECERRHRS